MVREKIDPRREILFDPLQASFMQHIEGAAYRPNIPIVPAQLGERAGAVGAAVLARVLLSVHT